MRTAFARAARRAVLMLAVASGAHAQDTGSGTPGSRPSTPPASAPAPSPLAPSPVASTSDRATAPPPSLAPSTRGDSSPPRSDVPTPFSVGEHLDYDVKFGIIHVGGGSMEVSDVQSVRGHDVWHTIFRFKGGTIFYHVNDVFESWFEQDTMASLRFAQHLEEGGKVRNRNYEIYPDRSVFQLNDKPEQPSVTEPLDDGSFLYFVRTLPLKVGDTYTFDRYFNPKSNPVVIKVLRRERISVPAGKFDAIVVQPTIKTSGIFSDKGEAQVWFSDDSARIVLQMKSKLSFGSLDLYLKSYRAGRGAAASVPTGTPSAPGSGVTADTVAGSAAAPPSQSRR